MNPQILLVDDEDGIRKVLGIFLSDSGYDVLTAENGEKALEICREYQPPIVLSDIKMPGMDGIELLKRIKKLYPETEVIMISAHGDIELAIQSLKYEAADFVLKPIQNDSLEVALKRATEKILTRQKLKDYTENLERLVKEKSEKLVETERLAAQRYQQLFDEVPCYISVIDKSMKLTAVNRRFKEDFGDAMGSYCYAVYKNRTSPCSNCPVQLTFEDTQSHYSEAVVTSKTGEAHIVLVWTAPICDHHGTPIQVMEMATDVTQVRKLQNHLSSLGLLLGSVSHNIKGLLTGLDGGMYSLTSGFAKKNEELLKEGFETVKIIVSRLRKMVLDILYYAKERELQWEKVDVLAFAEELAAIIEPKLSVHGVGFITCFDSSVGTVEFDAGAVHSALLNILENALDACLEDKNKPDHHILFSVKQDENHLIFEIQDNGIGMDKETTDKLFTLFFSSKGQKGTGLGLFIADTIIRQHSGIILVESSKGIGTTFHVKLPNARC
ncbi:MAG: response regulator [Desulfobacterales bacterium]|nr:response regulator [Desulfobacterales bacterium]